MNPIYLNATDKDGNRSEGPAVLALQIFLLGHVASSGDSSSLRPTGIYDDTTVFEVTVLQDALGFRGPDIDGFCGPGTRDRIREIMDVDLDYIFSQMKGPGRYAQADGTMLELDAWPKSA